VNLFKSKIIVIICLFSFLGTGNYLYGQIHCGTAAYITVNGNCVNKSLVAAGNTMEAPIPAGSSCATPPATASYRDVWAKFTAIATTATITGAITVAQNITIVTYSAPCNTTVAPTPTLTNAAELGCANANNTNAAQTETLTMTGLTIGQDYFIRIINTNATNTTINLCVTSTPLNDDPTGAGPTSSFSLTAPSSSCTYTLGNIKGASKTTCGSLAAPTCTSYGASSVDAWYSVTVPASGNLFLQTLAGNMSQFGIATYTGTPCVSLTQIGCSEGNPEGNSTGAPSLYVPGQTPGSTVYIRVWNKNGQTAGTFSICATTLGPCGNDANNDYCSNPASVATAGATFTSVATNSTTAGIYSSDTPGNLTSNSCTSGIGENVWFSFIATTTSQSIPFNVAGCAGGLEAEVFSVSTNQYGCCKTFTPVSSGSPFPACSSYFLTNNSTGTITASPLTIGNTYYLMLNSVTGQTCTYTVTGWSVSGILPVELISFTGKNEGKYNQIEWVTSTEQNIDNYTLERSIDAITFEEVLLVKAKGGIQGNNKYKVKDEDINLDLTYYRIKQKEYSGTEKYSNIISVNLKSMFDNVYNIHPNPTASVLNFEYYADVKNMLSIEMIGYGGSVVFADNKIMDEGKNVITLPLEQLERGVYILKVVSEKTGKTTHHKIIKN
jgi:hypothetical protein